jgi:hypothetical protein
VSPDDYADLVDEHIDALHEHVVGINAQTAAVELLASHRVWLARPDFARFIQHGRCHSTRQPMATIRWRPAHTAMQRGQLPCSDSEAKILRIAVSLAAGVPISLRDVLGCLDHRNIAHVVRAIGIANDTWPIDTQGIRS